MADALESITKLINSPPAHLAAGGVLAGIVWKFFERVEAVLTDSTKLEIAVWLVGMKQIGPKVEPWPDTFAKIFDRVFGKRHLSWKCLIRSCLASYSVAIIAIGIVVSSSLHAIVTHNREAPASVLLRLIPRFVFLALFGNVLPDYISLLETRFALSLMNRFISAWLWMVIIVADLIITTLIAVVGSAVLLFGTDPSGELIADVGYSSLFLLWILPAFFTSIWIWLYAGSGFILKAARRYDIGFEWFNRKLDIGKKPLQSIGLVAGVLVALVYWAVIAISRIV
jgi:hypothetical protein